MAVFQYWFWFEKCYRKFCDNFRLLLLLLLVLRILMLYFDYIAKYSMFLVSFFMFFFFVWFFGFWFSTGGNNSCDIRLPVKFYFLFIFRAIYFGWKYEKISVARDGRVSWFGLFSSFGGSHEWIAHQTGSDEMSHKKNGKCGHRSLFCSPSLFAARKRNIFAA